MRSVLLSVVVLLLCGLPGLPASAPQPTLPTVSSSAGPSAVSKERRIALVIGNGQYKVLPQLPNPQPDAEGVAAALKDAGFVLVGGKARIDLGYREFMEQIKVFSYMLQGGAVGMFYYSGHGIELGGRNFLVPVDANPQRTADADFEL